MLTDIIYRTLRRTPHIQRQFKRAVVRLPRRQRQVVHFGHWLWVDPSQFHDCYLYYEREYDDYTFSVLGDRPANFARALDIGANIGVYASFLAA